MTVTRTSTASAESTVARPRIGVLGIMQELYDEMLPGITERQGAYAEELGRALGDALDVHVLSPARDRAGIEAAIRELEASKAAPRIFGQDVVDHYLNAARVEQETYDSIVHNWERERYLERS